MIRYKIDVLAALKKIGISTYKIRRDKILNESTVTKIRNGEIINAANLDLICSLLNCQVGDILEYIPDDNGT